MTGLDAVVPRLVAGTATTQQYDAHRQWLRDQFADAANRFGVAPCGEPLFGFRSRAISARCGDLWLRVVVEQPQHLPHPYWTGNQDANVITGVPKPAVSEVAEWDGLGGAFRVRAELSTVLPGRAVSATDVLRHPVALPDVWWQELRGALDVVRAVPTDRFQGRGATCRHARHVFGDHVADRATPKAWETVHGDLHWANLLGPDFGVVDWEMWGLGPVGMDAANLWAFTALVPSTAAQVWDVFRGVLASPDGVRARVAVASSVIVRADTEPELVDLAGVLLDSVRPLVGLLP